jgi:DNA recombination protein RmuC
LAGGANSLRNDSRSRGLIEGREYISQGRVLGLKSEAGGTQMPDIIVMLPEKRTMMVDSKVPLTSYERRIGAKDEAERVRCTDQFVRDVKALPRK